jgi:hypothetical protein
MKPQRPLLTEQLSPEEFKRYYWEKRELAKFCNQHRLYAGDGRLEITERIEKFLTNGVRDNPIVKKISTGQWDSEKFELTPETIVQHYKSDPVTREFFAHHIGQHFKFKAGVLTWIKQQLQQGECFTYGDIIKQWLEAETLRKDPHYKKEIPKQFEYNRFTQAWSNANEGKGVKAAWNILRTFPGEATYEHYIELRKQELLK